MLRTLLVLAFATVPSPRARDPESGTHSRGLGRDGQGARRGVDGRITGIDFRRSTLNVDCSCVAASVTVMP